MVWGAWGARKGGNYLHIEYPSRYSSEDISPIGTAVCLIKFFFSAFTAASFKAGKVNVTTASPGLFACEQIQFTEPFNGGSDIKVFASFSHSVKSPTRGYGGAIWVESESQNGFKTCISEYSEGSNGTAEVNWIAVQSAPSGTQTGTTSLSSWTTGTECKRIDFPQVSSF